MKNQSERERIKEIISVFIKHGIRDGIKNINNPVQMRLALEELGPTFVKIGQILSTRPDIMPESYIEEFQKLQDSVKPENYDDIKKIIEKDLNGKIEDLFLKFDKVPIASASMAQVHLACLKNKDEIVVKIQRPRARETMFSDIAILKRLTKFINLTPQGNVLNSNEIAEELLEAAKRELNFLFEAESIKKFYENNKQVKYITCPKVYDEYTTSNILIMGYIDGIKIARTDVLIEQGYDLKDIASKFANNYFKQIFEDGFFHADPHPGNILISNNKIAYIDFGMMGTLSKSIRDKFTRFLYGVATNDVETMTQSVIRIGIKKGAVDAKKLYSDIEQIYNEYIEISLYELNLPQMMEEIVKACRKSNIIMPSEITMLLKGVLTVEGVVAKIAPDINVIDIAIPYAKGLMLKERDYKQDILEQLDNLYILSKSGVKIPIKLLELINCTLAGKLKVQMEHLRIENSIGELNKMVNRIVFGLIVSALIIGSSTVINADVGPKFYGISSFGLVGYLGAGIAGLWLLISIMKSGKM